IEVVSPDTTCRVPAGTFSCVHYRARRPDGSVFADTWYAAGVGQVGSETLREARVGDSTRTLRRVKRLVARSLHPASRWRAKDLPMLRSEPLEPLYVPPLAPAPGGRVRVIVVLHGLGDSLRGFPFLPQALALPG